MAPQIVIMTEEEVEKFEKDEGVGAMLTDKGPLPLKVLDVQARLEGLIGELSLTQVFVNTHAEPLEATYIFPLPDRAAVTSFRMEVAGRVVEGILKERGAARQEYDEAIQAGHRAAIAEEERPGVFTMRVGNLPPGEAATVKLTLVGPLVFDSGEVTFRFPLVVAPRYIPGVPLDGRSVGDGVAPDTTAVPDASRITPPVLLPGYPNPVRFSMNIDVQPNGLPFRDLRSSLHAVTTETSPNGATRITIQPGERLNRDVILRYRIAEESIQSSLTLSPDADGQEGTYLLTIVPPLADSRKPVAVSRPRDIVFVLDRSGSMDGWKMVAARRALGRMIDTLTEKDSFTVLAFDDVIELPAEYGENLITASDRHRFRVIEWLAKIEARNGTEMAQPLAWGVEHLSDVTRERVLVLLTDGQVGNEDQILQALAQHLKGIRIFTLGIDTAVNEGFLRRLAALGGGSFDLVESEDRLDEVMDKVQRRIGKPLWTGLKIEPSGIELDADAQVPARLPDLFAGAPLTVLGRYRGKAQGTVTLSASDDAGQPITRKMESQVSVSAAPSKLWARGLLRDMEDSWVVGDYEVKETLQKQILDVSLKFGVMCRFTAFVAVDRVETVNQGGKQQQLTQPVELPQGWTTDANASAFGRCKSLRSMSVGIMAYRSARGSGPYMNTFAARDAEEMPEDSEMELCEGLDGDEETNGHETNGNGHEPHADEEYAEAPVVEVDLTAYRQRAREMLAEMRADPNPTHAIGVLRLKLQALVEDLQSIGAENSVVEPLSKLLEAMKSKQLAAPAAQLAAIEKVLFAFLSVPSV